MTVLHACTDLYGKQVFCCTSNCTNYVAVYLYCYLDGIRTLLAKRSDRPLMTLQNG